MYIVNNSIVLEDLAWIHQSFHKRHLLNGSTILVTGCAGFLGYYFMNYFTSYAEDLGIERIIGLDNFLVGKPEWLESISFQSKGKMELYDFDIIDGDLSLIDGIENANFIIHMASVASPTFYRKYPIETLDANIWGLRRLLDLYRDRELEGFLMFSSSEVYGDPDPDEIPTSESYLGNVSTIGPRACYDEAKRFSETLCYLYAQKYKMPITLTRPFNNYGPGMRLDDKRVPADFAQAVVQGKDIEIFSDGTPTRTFCYVSDAITGYLKVMTHGEFDIFNIGIDKPEIQIRRLAEIYVEMGNRVFGYQGEVRFAEPPELDYMTHNPNRRCPDISHAREKLGYSPVVTVENGVERFLRFLKEGCDV